VKVTVALHSLRDPPPVVGIAKAGKPFLEEIGLPELDHASLIDDNRRIVNYR